MSDPKSSFFELYSHTVKTCEKIKTSQYNELVDAIIADVQKNIITAAGKSQSFNKSYDSNLMFDGNSFYKETYFNYLYKKIPKELGIYKSISIDKIINYENSEQTCEKIKKAVYPVKISCYCSEKHEYPGYKWINGIDVWYDFKSNLDLFDKKK